MKISRRGLQQQFQSNRVVSRLIGIIVFLGLLVIGGLILPSEIKQSPWIALYVFGIPLLVAYLVERHLGQRTGKCIKCNYSFWKHCVGKHGEIAESLRECPQCHTEIMRD
jgi:hypothetical protein